MDANLGMCHVMRFKLLSSVVEMFNSRITNSGPLVKKSISKMLDNLNALTHK